jgi:TolA-binding protein
LIALLSLNALAEEATPIEISPTTPVAAASPSPQPTDGQRRVDQIAGDEKSKATELWNRAMEAFAGRDFKTSAKLLQEYVDRYSGTPEGMDARLHLGQSYLFGREPAKAIAPFLSVVEVRGKSALGNEARTYLGQAYLDAGKPTEAYLVSEEILSQEGTSSTLRAKALLLRAHAQAGMKQNLEAEKTLVAFQTIAENDPELERETAASFLVSLLLKSNHCDALPSAKALPEDQLIDQVSRKSVCVLEMGTYLAKASKRLSEEELRQGAETLAGSLGSLRAACANPPLLAPKGSKSKIETAKRELSEKLRESCKNAETLIAEAFKERENLRPLQARIFANSPASAEPSAKKNSSSSARSGTPRRKQPKKPQPSESPR